MHPIPSQTIFFLHIAFARATRIPGRLGASIITLKSLSLVLPQWNYVGIFYFFSCIFKVKAPTIQLPTSSRTVIGIQTPLETTSSRLVNLHDSSLPFIVLGGLESIKTR